MNKRAKPLRIDRTWPLPGQPWVMRMTWSDLLFAHWSVETETVASLLPAGVTLDTRDSKAWVGVVPFLMSNIAPRLCPPIPGLCRFLELNVRTYVTIGGKPGVWFFSLDAARRVAVRVAYLAFGVSRISETTRWNPVARFCCDAFVAIGEPAVIDRFAIAGY